MLDVVICGDQCGDRARIKNLLDSCLRFLRGLQFESGHLRGPLLACAPVPPSLAESRAPAIEHVCSLAGVDRRAGAGFSMLPRHKNRNKNHGRRFGDCSQVGGDVATLPHD